MERQPNGLWLRLYTDLPDNLKLRRLSPDDQLLFVWCLCLHKRGHLAGQTAQDVAWRLRLPPDETAAALSRLVDARLLGSDYTPNGWKERQFLSDTSTERVRKHRGTLQRSSGETFQKRFRNVTVTPSETETETETENTKNPPAACSPSASPPAPGGSPKVKRVSRSKRGLTPEQSAIETRMIDHWTKRWSERHQNVAFAGTGGDYARIRQACKTLKWDESLITKTIDAYLSESEPFYGMHPTTLLISRLSTFAAKAQGVKHGRSTSNNMQRGLVENLTL